MNWIVIVNSAVVFNSADELLARAKAEQLAAAGATATLAHEEGICRPAPKQPTWTP